MWLAHDPNDPAVTDPNLPRHGYLTDPNSPGYVPPSGYAVWYPKGKALNYVTTGDSEYAIDLADLMCWLEGAPWLWRACWLTDNDLFETMAGGEEMLLMDGGFFTQTVMPADAIPAQAGIQPDTSRTEQIAQLAGSIVRLEQIWSEQPGIRQEMDAENWYEFMDTLYRQLADLYMGTD